MADNRFSCGSGSGRETVCIETNRVLDSCRDRDCFENVRVLLTDFGRDLIERTNTVRTKNVPSAVVEAVDPIILSLKVLEREDECNCCCCCRASDVPERVTYNIDGPLNDEARDHDRYLAVSMGIFSVVRIVRPAQYLINATEYSVPDKECVPGRESDPCSLFNTMAFPTAEFNPPSLASTGNVERRCGGGCNTCGS